VRLRFKSSAFDSQPLRYNNIIMRIGIHRFLVFGNRAYSELNDGRSPAVITQTDVVRYFLDNLDTYPHVEVTRACIHLFCYHYNTN
jgi:hypothetical protein